MNNKTISDNEIKVKKAVSTLAFAFGSWVIISTIFILINAFTTGNRQLQAEVTGRSFWLIFWLIANYKLWPIIKPK